VGNDDLGLFWDWHHDLPQSQDRGVPCLITLQRLKISETAFGAVFFVITFYLQITFDCGLNN
jgi:hypothetical protein